MRWTVILAFALGLAGIILAFVPGLAVPALVVCGVGILTAIIALVDINVD